MTQERMDALAKLGTKIAKDSFDGLDEELSFTEAEYSLTAECLFALPHYIGSDSWNGEELHYLMEAIRAKNFKLCSKAYRAYRGSVR